MEMRVTGGCFKLDDKPRFVNSGEIHYFRIEPQLWSKHLEKAKQAGLDTVSTYVPWCVHEPREGEFNFDSFINFAETVKKHGLFLIARVGPVSNAEMEVDGLPQWTAEKYPQVFLKGKDLPALPHVTLVAYNHPKFLELVEKWYDRLIPLVAGRQVTSGGPISLVQLCNEIGMVHWLNKAPDRNEYSDKMYRGFLENKYGHISELNKAHGTDFTDFESIQQPDTISINFDDNLQPYYDWMYYYFEYFGRYFKALYDMASQKGINVPVIANIPQYYDYDVRGRGIYSPMTTLMFSEFPEYVNDVILGGAYQMRHLDYENFHDVFITTEVVRMVADPCAPVMCCELQTGIMRDRPRLYPSDVELNLKTSTAAGLNGLNGYMFSGGVNPKAIGAMGLYHEWQAAVDSKGEPRPHYYSIEQFGRIINTFGDQIAETKKEVDVTIGFYKPYYATEYLSGPFVDALEHQRTKNFFDGLARIMSLAGYSYDFVDMQKYSPEELKKKKKLIVYSLEFMDEDTQSKLAEYVKSGGKLLIYPRVPFRNLKGEGCSLLAKELGIEIKGEIEGKFAYMNNLEILLFGKMQEINSDNSESVVLSGEDKTCGLLKEYEKGKIAAVCTPVTHIYDYMLQMSDMMMKLIDVNKSVETAPGSQVIALMRKKASEGFLFIFNYQEIPRTTWIKVKTLDSGEAVRIPAAGEMFVPPRTAHILPVNIEIEGVKIKYSTIEIEDVFNSSENGSIVLKVRESIQPSEIVLVCEKPLSIKDNDRDISYVHRNDGTLKISVPEKTSEIKISLK